MTDTERKLLTLCGELLHEQEDELAKSLQECIEGAQKNPGLMGGDTTEYIANYSRQRDVARGKAGQLRELLDAVAWPRGPKGQKRCPGSEPGKEHDFQRAAIGGHCDICGYGHK
jgi:hypothetical protein